MYDIAIIGDGPAGLSAGINAKARNKKAIIIGRGTENSSIYKAEKVDNYLGMYAVNGKEMMDGFYKHAVDMKVDFKKGRVQQVYNMGTSFTLNVDNEMVETKAVILANGSTKSKSLDDEEKFLGKGVSYCATCDGMLYRKKVVVVVSEIEEGEQDAIFLSEICSKVYYISMYGEVKRNLKDVEVIKGKPKRVVGDDLVTGIDIDGEIVNVDGIFIIKKSVPLDSLITGLEIQGGKVIVDKECKTNINGVFACGDVVGGYYQVAKAVGEGLVAGLNASKYVTDISLKK